MISTDESSICRTQNQQTQIKVKPLYLQIECASLTDFFKIVASKNYKMPVSKPGESQTDRFPSRGGAVLLGRAFAAITHRAETGIEKSLAESIRAERGFYRTGN